MKRKTLLLTICMMSVMLIFACQNAKKTDEANDSTASEEASGESAEDDTANENDDTADNSFDIELAFAGDINFDESLPTMQTYRANGSVLSTVIDDAFQERMREADLFWINNEFAYSDKGEPLAGKMWTFCSPPEDVSILDELGVDVAGLANNHVYDYGENAMRDTLATLSGANIPYVGAGYNLSEAMRPVYLEADGVRIAYVAASRAEKYQMTPQATEDSPGILRCYDNTLFIQEIEEAAVNADYVIALPHWGTEHSTVLEEPQLSGAKAYIDAGADAVIGAHPHILQGLDFYEDKPIVYSLGNFWFDEYTIDTVLAVLHLSGEKDDEGNVTISEVSLELVPGTQENCITTIADSNEERRRIFDDLEIFEPATVTIDDEGLVKKQRL